MGALVVALTPSPTSSAARVPAFKARSTRTNKSQTASGSDSGSSRIRSGSSAVLHIPGCGSVKSLPDPSTFSCSQPITWLMIFLVWNARKSSLPSGRLSARLHASINASTALSAWPAFHHAKPASAYALAINAVSFSSRRLGISKNHFAAASHLSCRAAEIPALRAAKAAP